MKLQSIIILTFNALEYTKRCLNSIQVNSVSPYELIVIDNNSSDGTQEWLKSQFYITHLILNKENKGVAGGRNQGLKLAKGDYITFLDNDTEVGKRWQRQILSEFDAKSIGIVGKQGSDIISLNPISFEPVKNGQGFCDVVAGFCFTFKRDLLGIIGYQFEDFPNGKFWHEDLEFCLRCKLAGLRVKQAEINVKHYPHQSMGQNVSNEDTIKLVGGFYENARLIQERLSENNIIYIHRNWNGFDVASSYDRLTEGFQNALRELGEVVIRRPSIITDPISFDLCKGIEISYRNRRFVVLHQENDLCPKSWQEPIQSVDQIFCGSPHIFEICKAEPYFNKLINITPTGIDETIFNYNVKPLENFYNDKFKFLMVSATQPRKNTYNLIKYYFETFNKNDNVVLIIKDMGYGQKFATELFIKENQTENSPELVYIYDDWSSDYLAQVYKTVALNGAYIHPHRAECFGMPHIEAVACGCRVGTTNWGGPKYNLKGNKLVTFFSYKLEPSTFHNWEVEPYYQEDEKPQWAEPNKDEIIKFMKDVIKEKYNKTLAENASKEIIKTMSFREKAKNIISYLKNDCP